MASPAIDYQNGHATDALRGRWVAQPYKSSALRALLHAEPVLQWFNGQHQTCQLPRYCVACRVRNIALCYWTPAGHNVPVGLDRLREACISKRASRAAAAGGDTWEARGAQDAWTFMRWLINSIHNDSELLRQGAAPQHPSPFAALFTLQFRARPPCQHQRNNDVANGLSALTLQLPLDRDTVVGGRPVPTALRHFIEDGLFRLANAPPCAKCRRQQLPIEIRTAPPVLALVLGRFERAGQDTDARVDTDVGVDLELDMARFGPSGSGAAAAGWVYGLRAVIHHFYTQPARGTPTHNFKVFVRERGPGGVAAAAATAAADVWTDFSTAGEPQVDVARATRAHAGCVPYVLLYERRAPAAAKKATVVDLRNPPAPSLKPGERKKSDASKDPSDAESTPEKAKPAPKVKPGDSANKPITIDMTKAPSGADVRESRKRNLSTKLPHRKRTKLGNDGTNGLTPSESRLAYLADNIGVFKTQHDHYDERRRVTDEIVSRIQAWNQGTDIRPSQQQWSFIEPRLRQLERVVAHGRPNDIRFEQLLSQGHLVTTKVPAVADGSPSFPSPGPWLMQVPDVSLAVACRLSEGTWLSDGSIETFLAVIANEANRSAVLGTAAPGADRLAVVFSTWFWPRLEQNRITPQRPELVRASAMGARRLVVPVHTGVHWLLHYVDLDARTVQSFDSLGAQPADAAVDAATDAAAVAAADAAAAAAAAAAKRAGRVEALAESTWRQLRERLLEPYYPDAAGRGWRHSVGASPRQPNGNDCGAYMLWNATRVLLGRTPATPPPQFRTVILKTVAPYLTT